MNTLNSTFECKIRKTELINLNNSPNKKVEKYFPYTINYLR